MRYLFSRSALVLAVMALFVVGFAPDFDLHAQIGSGEECSTCGCSTNPFDPLYHPDACEPLELWPHHCFFNGWHHCDNYS